MTSLQVPGGEFLKGWGFQITDVSKDGFYDPERLTMATLEVPKPDSQFSYDAADGNHTVSSKPLPATDISSDESKNMGRRKSSALEEDNEQPTILEKFIVTSLFLVTTLYDIMTLPIYFIIQQPWRKIAKHKAQKGVLVDKEKMIYGSATPRSKPHLELLDRDVDTMEKIFSYALSKNPAGKCLGYRDVIKEEEGSELINGKPVKRLKLSNYKWMTCSEVDQEARNLSSGLASVIGLSAKSKIAIFAETRKEWLITAMAAFKQNLSIVTIYSTLADDGVIHALGETEISCLVISENLMTRMANILSKVPSIQNLIYFDRRSFSAATSIIQTLPNNVQIIRYTDLVRKGRSTYLVEVKPNKEDCAIIMYTSGTTGNPKGVILSHGNIVSGVKSMLDSLALSGQAEPHDKYIAYLPLAHVLEIMAETISLVSGIPIGYSSPLTLTDQSIGLMKGTIGDATLLQPTIMTGVPLVLERIIKGIQTTIDEKGKFFQMVFDYFLKYKLKWYYKGYDTPFVNNILFGKMKAILGGRVRFLAIGSAPLAEQTQEFMRAVLSCQVVLGYAMTESACSGTLGSGGDLTVGRVGGPMQCTQIKLVDWKEGGYRVTDKPYPRGEILMGGENIASGYFKRDTSSELFEEDGKRWIRTGDIGEVHPDGAFKLIDRKKDLVKLSHGEYISLGKVESALKTCKYVDNTCVYAGPLYSYAVAFIVPAKSALRKFAKRLSFDEDISFEDLCEDSGLKEALVQLLQTHLQNHKLNKFEIPKKIHLCPEPWMPNTGLVTAAFKIRRHHIYQHYQADITKMYEAPLRKYSYCFYG